MSPNRTRRALDELPTGDFMDTDIAALDLAQRQAALP